jgi:hypothetical protein
MQTLQNRRSAPRRVHVAINLLIDRASPSVAGALHYLIRASVLPLHARDLDQRQQDAEPVQPGHHHDFRLSDPKWRRSTSCAIPGTGSRAPCSRGLRRHLVDRAIRRHWAAARLLLRGIPVFMSFLILNVAGILVLLGPAGFGMFANSIFTTATTTALATVPLFIVMGAILERSGSARNMLNATDPQGEPAAETEIQLCCENH